jgi:hypothetical protein
MNITRTRARQAAGLAVSALALCLATAACTHGNATNNAITTSSDTGVEQTMDNNQPAPIFDHSDIRATAIEIEAIQALGENTTSFAFLPGVKNPIWSCPSLGEPVAATDEITNPQQVDPDTNPGHSNSTSLTLPNMDPNGIYEADSTGTYVLCVNSQGVPYAHYWEGYIDAVSGPATWDPATGQVVVTGAPEMPSCAVKPVNGKTETVCTK